MGEVRRLDFFTRKSQIANRNSPLDKRRAMSSKPTAVFIVAMWLVIGCSQQRPTTRPLTMAQPQERRSDVGHLFLDPVTFLAETAFLPVELDANPPGETQVWSGAKTPPTSTAQPPMPPEGGMKPIDGYLYGGPVTQTGPKQY